MWLREARFLPQPSMTLITFFSNAHHHQPSVLMTIAMKIVLLAGLMDKMITVPLPVFSKTVSIEYYGECLCR